MPLRIIWAALLMGQIMFLVITLTVGKSTKPAIDAQMANILLYCAIAMLAVMVPMAYLVRGLVYRKGHGDDGLIGPGQYATGNILLWAMCEGVGLAAITFAFINGGQGPVLFVAAVAIAVQVVNFPTGGGVRWK